MQQIEDIMRGMGVMVHRGFSTKMQRRMFASETDQI